MMSQLGPMLIALVLMPFLLIVWNRQRVRGKLLCFFVRKDKSVIPALCKLEGDFIHWKERAYDIYPDFISIFKYPMGWPSFLQELVPSCLYDEEDAVPLDWINLDSRKYSAMTLQSELNEHQIKAIVEETAKGAPGAINWRKFLPFILLGIGVVGLIVLFVLKSKGGA